MRQVWLLVLLLCGVGAAEAHEDTAFQAQVVRVVDGDSLWVRRLPDRLPLRLRLHGLDAPELCQPHGAVARDALARRLSGAQTVHVQLLQRDSYQRWLARVSTAAGDVGGWQVAQGHAWSDRWGRERGPYAALEAQARERRLGLFATRQPERPRDFRRRHGPCPVMAP